MIIRCITQQGRKSVTCGYFKSEEELNLFVSKGGSPVQFEVKRYEDDANPAEVIPDVQSAWEYLFFTGHATGIDGCTPNPDDAYANLRVCGKAWNLFRKTDPTHIPHTASNMGERWRPSFKLGLNPLRLYCDGASPVYGFSPFGPWLTFADARTANQYGIQFQDLFIKWLWLGRTEQ